MLSGGGPEPLPPVHLAVPHYRQTNRRQGDIFAKKNWIYIFDKSKKNNIKIKKLGSLAHVQPSYESSR